MKTELVKAEDKRVSERKKELESDFDEIMSQYERYFLKHGFITPKHFDDFFSWLCGCRWAESNEPFGAMGIKEFDFKLYHEYKELKLNPSGWNDHQERERLEDRFNPQTPQPIKTQLTQWINDLEMPEINIENKTKDVIINKFEALKKWAKLQIDNL